MANRQRLTWNNKGAARKEASPPPQVPAIDRTEKSDHPAHYEDPAYDKYESGDPSAWAEDVHPGPYATSPAPATPGMDEASGHPAAKPGQPMKASLSREALRAKAAKCLRLAEAMFSSRTASSSVLESQALDFMDMPDDVLDAALTRLAGEDSEDEETAEDEGSDKEASLSKSAAHDIVARLDRLQGDLNRVIKAMNLFSEEGCGASCEGEDPMLEDAMLEEMVADDAHGRPMNNPEYGYMAEDFLAEEDEEADMMLEEMLSMHHMAADDEDEETAEEDEEGQDKTASKKKKAEDDDEEETAEDESEEKEASMTQRRPPKKRMPKPGKHKLNRRKRAADEDEEETAEEDEDMDKSAAEEDDEETAEEEGTDKEASDYFSDVFGETDLSDSLIQELYRNASDDEEMEEEEEEDEEEVEETASKKASTKTAGLRPQPKKAGKGPKSLGAQVKVASNLDDGLSSLWAHAPDVSEYFSGK